MIRKLYKPLLLSAFALAGNGLWAQAPEAAAPGSRELVLLLILTTIVVALVSLMLTITVLALLRVRKTEALAGLAAAKIAAGESPSEALAAAAAEVAKEQPTPVLSWKRISHTLTDAVPVEKEESIDLGHNYDGIRELDNSLPPWWKWGFYFTIGYAAVYLWHFHISEISLLNFFFGPSVSSAQMYAAQMEEGEADKKAYLAKAANLVDESSVTLLSDAGALSSGKEIYTAKCMVCHGPEGQGLVGPNLTDEFWLHGGGVSNVFKVIKYGVAAKGMQAWQGELKPQQIQQVASYILSLQGSQPANPKAPEGEKYVPQEAAPADSAQDKSIAMQ
jgi:cytochrome c oxidase cbb3-type subunit 3